MNETPAPDAAPEGAAAPGGTTPPVGATPPPGATPPGTPTGDPASGPGGPGGPATGMDGFFASVRRAGVVRSEERWVGGVAGGLALRLGIDPLIVRGIFGVAGLLGGIGLVLYAVGWLLLPEQRDGRIHLQQLFRGDFDAAVIGGFALLLMGFAYPQRWGVWGWGGDAPWWGPIRGLIWVAVIVAVVVAIGNRRRARGYRPPRGGYGAYGPTTSLRPGVPQPPAGGPMPAWTRPEGTPMYPAPPAPGAQPGAGVPPFGGAAQPGGTPGPAASGPAYAGAAYPSYGGAPWATRPVPPMPPVPPMGPMGQMAPAGPVTALPRTKPGGPGARTVGVVVALGLLLLAGLLYADREEYFDGPVVLTAAAAVVIMSGIGIAIAGFRGRTSGGLGAIAVVTILVVAPISAATDVRFDGSGAFIGEGTYTPRTVTEAHDGYSWTMGDVTVDLTDLPAGSDVEVPLHLGAGDLRVVLPADAAYTARIRMGVGDLTWLGGDKVSGVGNGWQTYESPAVQAGAEPDLELSVSIGAGNVKVVEG